MHADVALWWSDSPEKPVPDCRVRGRRANVLVFPDLQSANIAYKLVARSR